MPPTEPVISIVPANEASWEGLRTVFGTRGPGLVRNNRVPWDGRAEDKTDDRVWAVTCLFTRVGFCKRGVSRALARAAVHFARERGVRALEGYPMTTNNALLEELHVGTASTFANAGFA
jgi:GNAT superfamily N-acetyltransferase